MKLFGKVTRKQNFALISLLAVGVLCIILGILGKGFFVFGLVCFGLIFVLSKRWAINTSEIDPKK